MECFHGILYFGLLSFSLSSCESIDCPNNQVSSSLPGYYFPYLENKCHSIQQELLNSGDSTYSFYFITDTHPNQNYGNSGSILAYLSNKLSVPDLIFGGDIGTSVSSKWGESVSAYEALLKSDTQNTAILNSVKPNVRIYRIKGNHDYAVADADAWISEKEYTIGDRVVYRPYENDGGLWTCIITNADRIWNESHWFKLSNVSGYAIDQETSYWMIMADALSNGDIVCLDNAFACCYYFDRPDSNIRIICLDTCDTDYGYYGVSNVLFGVSDKQIEWFGDVALKSTPDNYDIIVVCHIPINVNASLSQDYVNRQFAIELRSILKAVNSRTSVVVHNRCYDFHDFSSKVRMVLSGHTHSDLITKTDGYFAVSCSGDFYKTEAATSPFYVNLDVPPRLIKKKKNTIYEQSFDVIICDFKNELIKFFRIGQGIDRYLNLNHLEATVGIPITIKTHLRGPELRYYCYDTDSNHYDGKIQGYTYSKKRASITTDGNIYPQEKGDIVVCAFDPNHNEIEFIGISIK